MTEKDWRALLESIEILETHGTLHPVGREALDAAERRLAAQLPTSYRMFCGVFGAGSFGRGDFNIATPDYSGEHSTYSLEYLTQSQRELAEQFGELDLDPEQISRGIFFSIDMSNTVHFFDPHDVTNPKTHEYGIYSLYRNIEIERNFDSFADFVLSGCLGEKRSHLLQIDDSPERSFAPMN